MKILPEQANYAKPEQEEGQQEMGQSMNELFNAPENEIGGSTKNDTVDPFKQESFAPN